MGRATLPAPQPGRSCPMPGWAQVGRVLNRQLPAQHAALTWTAQAPRRFKIRNRFRASVFRRCA